MAVPSALAWLKIVASKKTRAVRRYIAGVVRKRIRGNLLYLILGGFYAAR